MRKYLSFACVVVSILAIFSSSIWSVESLPTSMPDIGVSSDELNQDIALTAPAEVNDFKTTSYINLILQLVSENTIVFPPDYGVRMFTYRDDNWIEIRDSMVTMTPGNIIISPGGEWAVDGMLVVRPALEDHTKPVRLRIFIFGTIVEGGAETIAGSYVDVELLP